ncbi:hypothetical protein BDQ17DRAFT_1371515 [Cyathus striatus]|nr:hypothetical protein BDQ17DRAFT_1371515 [Cyathus striatus]
MIFEVYILLQPLMHYLKSNPNSEIYLFILNPKVDEASGGVSLSDAYWSLDNSGVETLSEFSAISIGLPIVRMPLLVSAYISYWDKYYYESLPEFYNACGVTSSDVWKLLGLSEMKPRKSARISQSSLYMEDLDVSYLAIKQDKEKKRMIPVEEYVALDKHFPERDSIISLSWIGISNLEDCVRIQYSMYARIIVQRKSIKYLRKKYAEPGIPDENFPYPVDTDDEYIDIL